MRRQIQANWTGETRAVSRERLTRRETFWAKRKVLWATRFRSGSLTQAPLPLSYRQSPMEEVQPCFLSVKHWKPQADLPTGHTRRLGVNSALSPEKGCAQHYRVGGSVGRGRGEASCGWWASTTEGGHKGQGQVPWKLPKSSGWVQKTSFPELKWEPF